MNQEINRKPLKPLLKWAGGKRQLMPEILPRIPDKWDTYFEPFAGGAALLCSLYSGRRIEKGVISDLNAELVNFYQIVRDSPDSFIALLSDLQYGNNRLDYLSCRKRFNEITGRLSEKVERAVLFVYLNRHSYNGLWRVNSRGKYNVPFGKYKQSSYPAEDEIAAFSRMLNEVIILNSDFRQAVSNAQEGDFVYFDPPYAPESKTANFTSYNSAAFNASEQKHLADLCRELDEKRVRFMVSNSDTEEIALLYEGFRQDHVSASRSINSIGSKRKGACELIIMNYD